MDLCITLNESAKIVYLYAFLNLLQLLKENIYHSLIERKIRFNITIVKSLNILVLKRF